MFNELKLSLTNWWDSKSLTWKILDCADAFFCTLGVISFVRFFL